MIDNSIINLHLAINAVPQRTNFNQKSMDYFWYSIASCIAVYKTEWLTKEMIEYISKQENKGEI